MHKGKLYLIPTTLGVNNFDQVLPNYNREIIFGLDNFVVEELRTARRFLRAYGYEKDFEEVGFNLLNEHTKTQEISTYLDVCKQGGNLGLLSEAGVPCIADPGNEVVKLAHQQGIEVVPLVGPTSIILSLMASGFNGQNFAFLGYLPVKPPERNKKLKQLEQTIFKDNQTQIFIEAPYRNDKLMQAMCENLSNEIVICVACEITTSEQFIQSKSVKEWKKKLPELHKKNTIFLLYK
ncbi:MAG: SAM-dependent methyltransferase [Bacteroidales bacterium]|nr:SAM-dependent methyltransferase [Bacteroidales bacterium]